MSKKKTNGKNVFNVDKFLGNWSDKDYQNAGVVYLKQDFLSLAHKKIRLAEQRIPKMIGFLTFSVFYLLAFYCYVLVYIYIQDPIIVMHEDYFGDINCIDTYELVDERLVKVKPFDKQVEICRSVLGLE